MRHLKILILSNLFLFLLSCGTIKEGFSNQKKNNSDEFLVEKKSPLVLPPNYGELPVPSDSIDDINKNNENDIQLTLNKEKLKINETIKNSKPSSLEKSILEKIK